MRLQSRGLKKYSTMRLCKNKFLNILLNILIIVVLPSVFGFLMYFYLEYMLIPVLIIPGFVAFLAGGLNNGANMN